MRVFAAGCIHGYWEKLYNEVKNLGNIDLVLVNGDATTFRTKEDLESTSSLEKAKRITEDRKNGTEKPKDKKEQDIDQLYGTFHKFYNGELTFPCMVIVIGGNNENMDLLFKLPFGGFIAPNIFYLGRAGIIEYKGIRISGFSGIPSKDDFGKKVTEKFPIRGEDIYTSYYTRSFSPFQLFLYSIFVTNNESKRPNILMSHDWPSGIPKHFEKTFPKWRRGLVDEDKENTFGNEFGGLLIESLKPINTTAAHHHLQFTRKYKGTNFYAMSRPEKKEWYSVFDVYPSKNAQNDDKIRYSKEWIAILKATDDYMKDPSLSTDIKDWKSKKGKIAPKVMSMIPPELVNLEAIPFDNDPDKATQTFCEKFGMQNPF